MGVENIQLAILAGFGLLLPGSFQCRAEIVRIATFNSESYLDQPASHRSAKSPEAKAKVRESLLALRPDVIALQEIGTAQALEDLRQGLSAQGLTLPHAEYVSGPDTNIHVAILSRFPFIARRAHTNESFLLGGRRFAVSRGFAEVEVRVTPGVSVTLIAAHLKSRRAVPQADEAELRLEEARLLRKTIDACLAANPAANLVVVGDLNDGIRSESTRAVVGRGKHKLVDTHPAERRPDDASMKMETRNGRSVGWTYYYEKDDTYSRIDFLLISPGLARAWLPQQSYVLALPDWGLASDHRPLVVAFDLTNTEPPSGPAPAPP